MDTKKHITEVGVAIAGAVDSGKSSFIGVLTSGNLDNGRGSARNLVAKHPHEIKSGQTSDISIKSLDLLAKLPPYSSFLIFDNFEKN